MRHHPRQSHRHGVQKVIRLVGIGLVVLAVGKELRTPPAERTWNGVLAGFVPYDLRVPTFGRFKERMWASSDERLLKPRVFGVGWTLNVGRVVELMRRMVRDRPATA